MPSLTTLSSRLLSCALTTALVLLLPPPAPVTAQNTVTGAFEGIITNSLTREPVSGAVVRIVNQLTGIPAARRSDAQGRFYQGLLPPGTYGVEVVAAGYKPYRSIQTVFATRTDMVKPLPILLEPEAAAVAPTPTPQPAEGGEVAEIRPQPQPPADVVTKPAETAAKTSVATPSVPIPPPGEESGVEINLTDGRRGDAFTGREVSTLPLGSVTLVRTFDELALLLPGVALPPQTQGNVAGPGVGAGVGSAGQFSVNGLPSRANNFTVDGSDNNDEDIGVRRQGFLSLVPQPVESIQEYQVITLLAPAQFGRNLGAQVNAVSKSGGNQTHGALFGFFNSSQLNAPNFFDNTGGDMTTRLQGRTADGTLRNVLLNGSPAFVTNDAGGEESFTLGQFGLVLGGPLVPSEPSRPNHGLFYFFSAEGQLLNALKEANFAVPTIQQRGVFRSGATGLSTNPFTGSTLLDPFTGLPTSEFPTTVGGDAIFSFFPFPNNPGGVYGENTFTQVLPSDGEGKVFSGKLNGNFNAFNRPHDFVARYNFTDDWRDVPVTGGALFSRLRPRVRTQNFSTYLNTQLSGEGSARPVFNQLRASYGRTRLAFDEGRDTQFLLPINRSFANPDDARFLLNTRFITNNTLPGSVNVRYDTFGTGETETQNLGFFLGPLGPVGQINIAGFSPVGVDVFNFPQRRVNNTYQLADTVTVNFGTHNVAFGADLRRTELISDLPRNARPLITFNGAPRLVCGDESCGTLNFATNVPGQLNPLILPEDFAAAGAPSGVFQSLVLPGRDSHINLRYYQLNFFGQDEWRVRRNFSLSYGLRYEYNTPPREARRRIEDSFSATLPPLVSGLADFIEGRTRIYDPDRNNFAPRVGFAWGLGPEQRTVIRAGYGLFYDQILGAVVSQSRNVFPTFTTINFGGGCCAVLDNGLDEGFNIFNPLGTTLFGVPIIQPGTLNTLNPAVPQSDLIQRTFDFFPAFGEGRPFGATLPRRRLDTPMAHHYSVTVEHQVWRNTVASAAYVGTTGRNLLRFTTPNLGPNFLIVPLTFTVGSFDEVEGLATGGSFGGGIFSGATLDPGALTASGNFSANVGRPNPNIGPITRFETIGESRYDALQLQLRGRFTRAQYQFAYTFSRAEDDVSDVFDLAGSSALPQNSLSPEGERAASNFDARHRFAYNVTYGFPTFNDRGRAFRFLFGGLELASTGQFQTGQPFTVNSIFDINLDGNLTDRLDRTDGLVVTGDRRRPLQRPTNDPTQLARTFLAPFGEDGSVGRNSFRAGNLLLINVAAVKHFAITETQRLTFRAEVFNLTNRANFGIPVRFLEAPGFGQATDTVTPGRRIQFALKYIF